MNIKIMYETVKDTNYLYSSGKVVKTIICHYCGNQRDYYENEIIFKNKSKHFCCYDCYAKYCKAHSKKIRSCK